MGQLSKVLAGIGAIIVVGLVLSHWKGSTAVIKESGTQFSGIIDALTLKNYSYPAENQRLF